MMKTVLKNLILHTVAMIRPDVGPKVLYYHDVFNGVRYTEMGTPLSLFEKHIAVAREHGFRFVSALPRQSREVQVLLDDGFRGVWDCRDFFVKQGIFPTICVIAGFVGREGYLTWEQILELKKMGFRFAAHTWNHRSVTDCKGKEDFDCELLKTRLILSDKLGDSVTSFCFPRGLFSNKSVAHCVSAGYKILYTSLPGTVGRFPIRRFDRLNVEMVPRNLVQASSLDAYRSTLYGAQSFFWKRMARLHDGQFRGRFS